MSSYDDKQSSMDAPGFFWTPADHITSDSVTLFGLEAKHAVSVCRLRHGEMMTVTDGLGNAYDCEVAKASPNEFSG